MKRYARLILTGVGSLAVVIGLGFGTVYALSQARIERVYMAPARPVAVDRSAAAVARGKRMAAIYGCTGCHGKDLTGKYVSEAPFPVIHAANLTVSLPRYTDAEIARVVREGVTNEGKPVWAMPSEGFEAISDRDMGDVIAFLRTHRPKGETPPAPDFGWLSRWQIATGEYEDIPALVRHARAKPAVDLGTQHIAARYLVRTACSECHGSDLKGAQPAYPGSAPDLMIAASYDLPTFTRLLRTGVAADGKERGLMTVVSRSRFSNFTDAEIAEIHAYLTARAEAAP